MAKQTSYNVPTKVLLEQARITLDQLTAPANADALAALDAQGLATGTFVADLRRATSETAEFEVTQERLKEKVLANAKDDQAAAEQGYRWVLRLQGKARHYLATVENDPHDVAGRLRFGELRSARARGVAYELRILLPEVDAVKNVLAPFGVNDALIAEGRAILDKLGVERAESAAARSEQEKATGELRKAEVALARLLDRLVAADEAAAMDRVEVGPRFPLDIIKTERARVEAARQARLVARPAPTTASPAVTTTPSTTPARPAPNCDR